LETAAPNQTPLVEAQFSHPDYKWRGFHPFGEIHDPREVGTVFWAPLKSSLTSLQRREDIFFAGANWLGDDGGVWV